MRRYQSQGALPDQNMGANMAGSRQELDQTLNQVRDLTPSRLVGLRIQHFFAVGAIVPSRFSACAEAFGTTSSIA